MAQSSSGWIRRKPGVLRFAPAVDDQPPNEMHNCQRSPFGSAIHCQSVFTHTSSAASRWSLWPPHPEGRLPPSRCLPLEPLSHICSLSHSVAPPVHVLWHPPPASAHTPPPRLLPASRKHVHVMNFYCFSVRPPCQAKKVTTFQSVNFGK